jgi:membrane-bound acyltransferase YfiQ involved in biofilm formation
LLRTVTFSLVVQLAFTTIAHFSLPVPPPLSWLAAHPGSWLFSYQLYVIAGVAVGLHIDDVTSWCSEHVWDLAVVAVAAVLASVAWYFVELDVLHNAAVLASDVFQPAVVLESLAVGALELGVCRRWTARAGTGPMGVVSRASDASFGIYLAHPLLLEVAVNAGLASALASLPPVAAVAIVVLVTTPVVFVAVGLSVTLLRRTPLSLVLCGRPLRRSESAATGARLWMAALRPAAPTVPAFGDATVRVP